MHNKFQNSELYLRVLSSIIMIVLSTLLLVLGGILFEISLLLLAAILAWEILGFDDNKNKLKILNASLFAFSFATYIWFLPILSLIFLFIFLFYYKIIIKHEDFNKRAIYFIVILLSLVSLSHLRSDIGLIETIWVICCVISSDIGGYFVGRYVGGPKLWPVISPKKTWSGIIGGWILALSTTYVFIFFSANIEYSFLYFSVFIAIFSQFGDLFESSIKRSAKVKDSSNLIPGHGGFLDRFDGMIGAFFAICVIYILDIYNWIF
jgi:phosphatidate cytidylyltransferase